jgi:hypothetical protein
VILGPLGTSATIWPILAAPDDRWWTWSSRWNENWQGKPKYSDKICPGDTSSTTNPTWTDVGCGVTNYGIQTLYAPSSVQVSELAGKCVYLNITSCRRTQGVEYGSTNPIPGHWKETSPQYYNQTPSKLPQAVTHLICKPEAPSSNLGRYYYPNLK